ncbi:MAG TPA: hotdog fold thioesterase [Methylomirabilota bacterium]|nr:hotdog fold thioesterase [Methylomirabilota bacterium]
MTDDTVPPELARTIENDPWARTLGVQFLELKRGYCRVALQLGPHMVIFQGAPHGGVIFSLADIAFGAACNSHGEPAVALSVTVGYLTAVRPDARLVAESRARRQGRRAGFYDVTVTSDDGRLVATVHCVAHRVGGEA